jgi:hypothetical protein
MESPVCRENVDDAVEITADTPRLAWTSDAGSFKSPTASSMPSEASCVAFSEAADRTSARTSLPRCLKARQISMPNKPVAPITSIIVTFL